MNLKYNPVPYLMDQNLPWIQYKMAKLKTPEDAKKISELKNKLLADDSIQKFLSSLDEWPEPPLVRHTDVKHPIHIAHLLLDIGLDASVKNLSNLAERILEHVNNQNIFLSLIHVPKAYGGTDEPMMGWLMCDYPLLLYFLTRMGYSDNELVKKSLNVLLDLNSSNGWHCLGSVDKFRGPGRKDDHCPIATLFSLKVFKYLRKYHSETAIKNGIDAIYYHWNHSKERKIYQFGMGTNFRKLKFPNVWYEIVHVVSVLKEFEYATEQPEFAEMTQIIADKQQRDGGFIPETIFTDFSKWDFGQKKVVSPTLTMIIWEMFQSLA